MRARLLLLVTAALGSGCREEPAGPPGGALGLRFGADAVAIADELGIECRWHPIPPERGRFDACTSEVREGTELVGDDVDAHGLSGWIGLVSDADGALVGISWWSRTCTVAQYTAFRSRAAAAFGLDDTDLRPGDPIGSQWESGASVHITFDADGPGRCRLSATNDDYGRAQRAQDLADLMLEIVGGLQPH